MIAAFKDAISLWRYTLYSSLIKISLRNSGSILGLIWEPLSTLLVSLILALVWIKVLGIEGGFLDYFTYLYVGMVIWGGMSSAVSNLCATLVKNANHITSRPLPIFCYIFEDIFTSFIPFLMSLPVVVVVIFIAGYELSIIDVIVFILGTFFLFFVSFAFSISVGLCAFFIGDIRQIITSIMRLSFLVTPIIWKPERLGEHEYLLLLNPFYGFLHILRSSLLGEQVEFQYIVQALIIATLLFTVGVIMYSKLKHKIQYRALVL